MNQACVIADHHLHRTGWPVLALKCLQFTGQFIVGLQVAVVGAQTLYTPVTLEAIEQAVA
ncbi:hypothetical protein D3C73_1647700 [compost metagenome]